MKQSGYLSPVIEALFLRAANRLREQLIESEKADAAMFADRFVFAPDPWQETVLRSNAKRIILNCCRQSGKSTTTAVLAAHRTLFFPGSLTLISAPSERQSAELLRKIREILDAYPDAPEFDRDSILTLETATASRIIALPSKTTNLRGFSSPDSIIIDEAAFCEDALFDALSPMLAVNPQARLILLSTPNGRRGRFFSIWENGDESWLKIKVTARECPRISDEFLESEKKLMPDFLFRQEYFCEFTDSQMQVFPSELIERAVDKTIRSFEW